MKSAHRSLTGTGAGTSPATTPKTTIAGRSLFAIIDVRSCILAGVPNSMAVFPIGDHKREQETNLSGW
jgi:hypothetical protein